MQEIASLGFGIALIGGIWLVIRAFKITIWWGLGSFLVYPILLIFVALHWSYAKKPFLIHLVGLVIMVVAGLSIEDAIEV